MKSITYFLLITFVLLHSCISSENKQIIVHAEKTMDLYPDSSLMLLSLIDNPEKLPNKWRMKYHVIRVLSKYKKYEDVKKDTVVFETAHYFSGSTNMNFRSLSNYVAGAVMEENDKVIQAMNYYKESLKALESTDNAYRKAILNGKIGFLYYKQYLFSDALKYFEKSTAIYSNIPNTQKNQLGNYVFITNSYLVKGQYNKGLQSNEKALKLATAMNDSVNISIFLNNIGLIYQEQQKHYTAISFFQQAINYQSLPPTADNRPVLNLSYNYLKINESYKADPYVEVLLKSLSVSTNLEYKIALTNFLSKYYESKSNYKEALSYLYLMNKFVLKSLSQNQSKALIEADKKFDYSVYKSNAEKAKLNQRLYILIFVGIILFFAVGVLIMWLRNSKQKLLNEMNVKTLQMQQQKQENDKLQLQKELNKFKFVNESLSKVMDNTNDLHYEINEIIQAGLLHEGSDRYKKIQAKLKLTQESIKDKIAINAESFLMERKLLTKQILSKLSVEEKIILTMLFNQENNKNIANILSVSLQAIYNRIPRLKSKLHMLELDEATIKIFFPPDNKQTEIINEHLP